MHRIKAIVENESRRVGLGIIEHSGTLRLDRWLQISRSEDGNGYRLRSQRKEQVFTEEEAIGIIRRIADAWEARNAETLFKPF